MRLGHAVLAVLVGLWVASALPGVGLGTGSFWARSAGLVGVSVVLALLWYLAELLPWFPQLEMTVTVEMETGSKVVFVLGTLVMAFLWIFKLGALLALSSVSLRLASWLAGAAGLGFELSGFWSPVLAVPIAATVFAVLGPRRRRPDLGTAQPAE